MTACLRTLIVFSTLRLVGLAAQTAPSEVLWTFDRLDEIGGVKATVEGNPKVVETPVGRAIEFDGIDDGVWIEKHPLAGAVTFTFEAIFRPDPDAPALDTPANLSYCPMTVACCSSSISSPASPFTCSSSTR